MLKINNGICSFTDSVIRLNFTTRQYPITKSRKNYQEIIDKDNPNYGYIYTTKQIHSSIVNITRGNGFYIGDGLLTDKIGEVLLIFTADCYPILIYSINPPVIGLIHAGWRGIYKNIIGNAVKIINLNFTPGKIKAFIGPGICKKCYSVREEMKEYFSLEYFSKKDTRSFLDLKSVIINQLEENGIDEIADSNFCTVCNNDLFFSYRAENKTKNRILTFAYIRGSGSL